MSTIDDNSPKLENKLNQLILAHGIKYTNGEWIETKIAFEAELAQAIVEHYEIFSHGFNKRKMFQKLAAEYFAYFFEHLPARRKQIHSELLITDLPSAQLIDLLKSHQFETNQLEVTRYLAKEKAGLLNLRDYYQNEAGLLTVLNVQLFKQPENFRREIQKLVAYIAGYYPKSLTATVITKLREECQFDFNQPIKAPGENTRTVLDIVAGGQNIELYQTIRQIGGQHLSELAPNGDHWSPIELMVMDLSYYDEDDVESLADAYEFALHIQTNEPALFICRWDKIISWDNCLLPTFIRQHHAPLSELLRLHDYTEKICLELRELLTGDDYFMLNSIYRLKVGQQVLLFAEDDDDEDPALPENAVITRVVEKIDQIKYFYQKI